MKVFRNVFKNKLFYLVLVLGVFFIPIFKFTLQAQESYDDGFNLASPDLEGKEYLGDDVYRLYNNDGITIDYDVYSGIWNIDGIVNNSRFISLSNNITLGELTAQLIQINGTVTSGTDGWRFANNDNEDGRIYWNGNVGGYIKTNVKIDNIDNLRFNITQGSSFDNFHFKLQLEEGDTATPYQLPIQALKQHVQLQSDIAYNDGYDDGHDEGYTHGYIEARDEYGYYNEVFDEWITAEDYWYHGYSEGYGVGHDYGYDEGYDIGYYEGVDDGLYDGYQGGYDDGYQDGTSDTHDYYDDNGLFIPKTTPKAHIAIDYDQRYGEPYFYLQDFSGDYDDEYFGFQHNKWLENAFDWAYNVEMDFLAINDLYTLKYESDEVIYKYFFYKYDTDSIYLYDDNGTLFKIVERVDFDYYIYEVPEISQEEQAMIDNAYDRGMWDYGYYDIQSEEYLTATEYGDIQYNKGVISTRDKAYSDGFLTAMWYSHLHGYNWVRVTYPELIVENPILHNVTDLTSFAYEEGYGEGFDRGEVVGYDKGYDVGLDDGFDEGYDEGFVDGEYVGYYDGYDDGIEDTPEVIYDEIYNKGYRDGQKTGMNNKFYTGLEKWLVPALIVVLFFGLLMLFPRNKED